MALLAVPAAWICAITPHFYAASLTLTKNDLALFDNVAPRAFLAKTQAQEKQSANVAHYLRAEAASANGFEQIGLFASAVVLGTLVGIPTQEMNVFAAGWIASRVTYNVSRFALTTKLTIQILYISTTSTIPSFARSVVFVGGVVACLSVFVKSATLLSLK